MWSGPRNLSTAMMYSFAARGDCGIWDEPFYAAYLKATGIDHPMRAEILAAHETDASVIADRCSGEAPLGEPIFYQKHMTLHMIPSFDRGFMRDCENVFLIRHPTRVVASYAKKREVPVSPTSASCSRPSSSTRWRNGWVARLSWWTARTSGRTRKGC